MSFWEKTKKIGAHAAKKTGELAKKGAQKAHAYAKKKAHEAILSYMTDFVQNNKDTLTQEQQQTIYNAKNIMKNFGQPVSGWEEDFYASAPKGTHMPEARRMKKGGKVSDIKYELAYTDVKGEFSGKNGFKQRVYVGIIEGGDLYFIEIKNDPNRYFSVSGDIVHGILRKDAIERNREHAEELIEDEGLDEFSGRVGQEFNSISEAVDYTIDTDGELGLFDNSLLNIELNVSGREYIFESVGAGQNKEYLNNLEVSFLSNDVLKTIKSVWDKYHIKNLPESISIPKIEQDEELLLEYYIRYITGQKYATGGSIGNNGFSFIITGNHNI